MGKEIYVSDKEYRLVKFTEEEKENYMRLMFPENDTSEFYKHEEDRELFWRATRNLKEMDFSIYTTAGEYCGNIELKNYDTTTPEIGIALMESQRNKGIAGRTIRMLAKKYFEETEFVEYFVLKVSSYNLHSKHMIEKIGAEFVCEEETLVQRSLRLLKEELGEEFFLKTEEKHKNEFGMSKEEQEEVVYRYKLMPDSFLH